MKKTFHYYLLMALLALVAATQIIENVIALRASWQYERLIDSAAVVETAAASTTHLLLARVTDLYWHILIAGGISLLFCVGGIWTLRRLAQEVVAPISDVDADEPIASKPAMPVSRIKVETQPVAKNGVDEQMSSAFYQFVHKAQHDSLTGLPNRTLAMDRMKQVLVRAERHKASFAVLFIDLNGFKALNDTYGHAFGDKVLRKTAERLIRSVRALDTVSRLGGDEFLIILDHVDAAKALETAQTLKDIVSQPVLADKGPVSVGMSAGIAMFPEHGRTVSQLVNAADAAMYVSKGLAGLPKLATSGEPSGAEGRDETVTTLSVRLLDTWQGNAYASADAKSAQR
ncbi:MAG: GGDEF domain-containing protein [Steroidobacteraceae bacterium]